MEADKDDDINSDEEVMHSSSQQCLSDLYSAIHQFEASSKQPPLRLKMLNNSRLKERVKFAHFYDRNGLFRKSRGANPEKQFSME